MPARPEELEICLLGTGTSTGVPVIGCTCRVCTSTDERDKRLRCSCLIRVHGLTLVVDTGPDFRTQALRAGVSRLDAVLFTHYHFDHVAGLDDVRPFFRTNRRALPCYASADTVQVLRRVFTYIFEDGSYPGVPRLVLHEVQRPFRIHGRYDPSRSVTVIPIPLYHGKLPIFGYRIGRFAYLTDTSFIPEESYALLNHLDVLVLDALRYRPHPAHFSIEEAVEAARRIGARETYFIHMTHDILHEEVDARLPEGIHLGYDMLKLRASL